MTGFAERHFRGLILLIWLATSLFLLVMGRDAIAAFKVGDPDDALRIVQVRDWLAGQSWWDVTQYRMNWPDGGPMHWSRLVDLPIAALILLFKPWLGQATAEQTAAAIVPLLTYGLALAFYAAALRRLWGASPAVLAAATFFLILPVIEQLVPMRIDHHGWQIMLFSIGLWALFDPRQNLRSAVVIGLALALWMEISVEALPFAVMFMGLLALRWLWPMGEKADEGLQLLAAAAAFAFGLLGLFSLTEHWSKAANFCDGLSPFHLAAAAAATATLGLGIAAMRWRLLPIRLWTKLAVGGAAALAAIATVLGTAPQCAGDAFATLDPLVRTYWFDRVAEGLPLWDLPLQFTAQPLATLLAGSIGCVWLWRGHNAQPIASKIMLTLLFAGCVVIGANVSRTFLYAMLVGHLLIAPMVIALFAKADTLSGLLPRTALRMAAVGMLMSAIIGQNLWALKSASAAAASPAQQNKKQDFYALARACQSPDAARMLNRLKPTHILAPLDSSPAILLFTQHRIVATGHHRNEKAMADVIRTFTGSADEARRILAQRRIDIVLTCDGSSELANYAEAHPKGFAAQLLRGAVPGWLDQQPDIGPFHIYKLMP